MLDTENSRSQAYVVEGDVRIIKNWAIVRTGRRKKLASCKPQNMKSIDARKQCVEDTKYDPFDLLRLCPRTSKFPRSSGISSPDWFGVQVRTYLGNILCSSTYSNMAKAMAFFQALASLFRDRPGYLPVRCSTAQSVI